VENEPAFDVVGAMRTGLFVTPINWHLDRRGRLHRATATPPRSWLGRWPT
jgi:hypothetical protein